MPVTLKFLDRVLSRKTASASDVALAAKARAVIDEADAFSEVSGAILEMSLGVGEFLKPHYPASDEGDRLNQWFWTQAEAIFFSLHMVNRITLKKLGTERRALIADKLGPRTLEVFVRVTFKDGDEQQAMKKSLLAGLQEREQEYARCHQVIPDFEKGELFFFTSVTSLATLKILEAAGHETLVPVFSDSDARLFLDLHTWLTVIYQTSGIPEKVVAAGNALLM